MSFEAFYTFPIFNSCLFLQLYLNKYWFCSFFYSDFKGVISSCSGISKTANLFPSLKNTMNYGYFVIKTAADLGKLICLSTFKVFLLEIKSYSRPKVRKLQLAGSISSVLLCELRVFTFSKGYRIDVCNSDSTICKM